MRIRELILHAPDLHAQAHFWGTALGLPILAHTVDSLRIKLGCSVLHFRSAPHLEGVYHYAIDVPNNQFEQAQAWIRARAKILSDEQGETVFFHDSANAHAIYFADGNGNIGELIARHDAETARMLPFGAESLLHLSEIGVASSDVIASVNALKAGTGLKVWRGAGSDTFTMLGDSEGVLIVTQTGRLWMPDQVHASRPLPTTVICESISAPFELEATSLRIARSVPDPLWA